VTKTKAPKCCCGCGKRAIYGTEHGFTTPRFATKDCGYKMALERTVDDLWCARCGSWWTQHGSRTVHCSDEDEEG